MRRVVQSIHVNPETEEGQEILSVLLAVPPYQRGALLRTILFDHIRSAALRRWAGIKPKTPEEMRELLANRPTTHAPGRPTPRRLPPSGLVLPSSIDRPPDAPNALDIEARLDQLQFP